MWKPIFLIYFLLINLHYFTADNNDIDDKTIAIDALYLFKDELKVNNMHLLMGILELMRILTTCGSLRPTEIHSIYTPHLLLPLLFTKNVSYISFLLIA